MIAAGQVLLTAGVGGLLGVSGVLLARGLTRPVVPLEHGLALLTSGPTERPSTVPVTGGQRRALAARGGSVREFFAEKVAWLLIGAITPSVVASCVAFLAGWSPVVPVGVALVGAAIGWFVPDIRLRREAPQVRADLQEALFTLFDLVTLERLANRSATQALGAAAALSENTLFVEVRRVLERARLEQRTPYRDLRRLASELDLPDLADLADVLQMEESGASLSGALRARVRELRDAQLAARKVEANAVSEQMTIFMVVPSLVFALVFLIPPLIRLSGIGGPP